MCIWFILFGVYFSCFCISAIMYSHESCILKFIYHIYIFIFLKQLKLSSSDNFLSKFTRWKTIDSDWRIFWSMPKSTLYGTSCSKQGYIFTKVNIFLYLPRMNQYCPLVRIISTVKPPFLRCTLMLIPILIFDSVLFYHFCLHSVVKCIVIFLDIFKFSLSQSNNWIFCGNF